MRRVDVRIGIVGACLGAAVCLACGGHGEFTVPEDSSAQLATPDTVEIKGRTFLRRDLWSDADFERILYEGRPEQDATLPEVLAAQLRAHIVRNGSYYIQLEPDVELAKKIQRGAPPTETPSQAPREARQIIGSDTRNLAGDMSYPRSTFGFNSTEGTGNRIGLYTIYTAAHIVFETRSTPNGWFCADGTHPATCASSPRWRFGVQGTNGVTPWTTGSCYTQAITGAFVALTTGSSKWDFARWDYAAIDISDCNAGNPGWLGTATLNDQSLPGLGVISAGYAERARCPTGTLGTDGTGGLLSSTDCPGTGAWPGSTWQLTGTPGQVPYTGAQLWISGGFVKSLGAMNPAYTIQSDVDITQGNSGGALYFNNNIGTNPRLIGVCSQHASGADSNIWNRWTNETVEFFAENTIWPNDTL